MRSYTILVAVTIEGNDNLTADKAIKDIETFCAVKSGIAINDNPIFLEVKDPKIVDTKTT